MTVGAFPFKAKTQVELVQEQKAIDNRVSFPPGFEIDPIVKDLIQKCLRNSESDRISCNELLQHPLFELKSQSLVMNVKEDDVSSLGQSVIRNTKRLLLNDDGIFINHAGNQVTPLAPSMEKDQQNVKNCSGETADTDRLTSRIG